MTVRSFDDIRSSHGGSPATINVRARAYLYVIEENVPVNGVESHCAFTHLQLLMKHNPALLKLVSSTIISATLGRHGTLAIRCQ